MFRAMIIGGPLGLAIVITLSLWVTQLHLQRSIVLQVHQTWRPGEQLAVRAQLLDHDQRSIEAAQAELSWLDDAGTSHPLTDLEVVPGNGVFQGRFHVPAELPEAITLELRFTEPSRDPVIERVPITVSPTRNEIAARHTVAATTLQWADDTDAQTKPLHIDLLPDGRMLAAFDNAFFVRVSDEQAVPRAVPVRVSLVSGEFAGYVGDERSPPVVFRGTTDRLGLARFAGMLASEVVRFEVTVGDAALVENDPSRTSTIPPTTKSGAAPSNDKAPTNNEPKSATESGQAEVTQESTSPDDAESKAEPKSSRRFRFVSYAGGVRLATAPLVAQPGTTVDVTVHSLRKGRRVHIDVHTLDGTWADTAAPDSTEQRETSWEFVIPDAMPPGVVQLEAYPYTNAPGESSALGRIQVVAANDFDHGIGELVERQLARLDVPRINKYFDRKHERKWLDNFATYLGPTPSDIELESARRWLIGTLPVELYGPPLALSTRDRELSAIAERKRTWTIALRWALLGGGGLFIALAGFAVSRVHASTTAAIDAELTDAGWSEEAIAEHQHSKRALMFRGFLLIVILVASLVLSLVLLESLVWVH